MDSGGETASSTAVITVHVKFGGRTLLINVDTSSTVRDLKNLLQPLTNVLPRGQKLIFKGKVLADEVSLETSQVTTGSKIMMIASHGLHQGDGPITKSSISSSTNIRKVVDEKHSQLNKIESNVDKRRSERWKITGVVALSECEKKVIPEEVWGSGASVRVLDLSNNFIKEVPARIGSLKYLKKLILNGNDINNEGISWEGLSSLKSLRILSLNQNQLTALPSTLGNLTSLTQLHIENNKLTSLPAEVGLLNQLEILKAAHNRCLAIYDVFKGITTFPSSIENCTSLVEVDLSSNLLADLPETIGKLKHLKALLVSNNGLKSLPSTLFKMCLELSTLDLHGTEITNDILRQVEGWEAFDERRRSKHQKQLDFRVGSSGVFDEGADDDRRL